MDVKVNIINLLFLKNLMRKDGEINDGKVEKVANKGHGIVKPEFKIKMLTLGKK